MDKYLIVGLGNPGDEYAMTRHNTGFMVLDAFAKASNIVFEDKRYGFVAETSLKGRKVLLLKPTTFMNLSGNAVRYWLNKENIDQHRLMVVSDDVALPLGQFRLKAGGSNGGHNGLGHIQQLAKTIRACGWASATTILRADRLTGCWGTTATTTCGSYSPLLTWRWKSSRVSCLPASTSR